MREMKFRAWDKADGVMWEWPAVVQFGFKILTDPAYIVMQYTGLKDKNGREIYEGDIVLWPNPEWISRQGEGLFEDPGAFIIKWEEPRFRASGKWERYTNDDEWEEFQIVGNIYENTELLQPGVIEKLDEKIDQLLADCDEQEMYDEEGTWPPRRNCP